MLAVLPDWFFPTLLIGFVLAFGSFLFISIDRLIKVNANKSQAQSLPIDESIHRKMSFQLSVIA